MVVLVGILTPAVFLLGMLVTNWELVPKHYASCYWARRANVTPIYRGQPGYRIGLDADRDGIACENFRWLEIEY
jgi:hypothetical protein